MTGYAFHCSRCKISHAGECPPAVVPIISQVDPLFTEMPLIGSRWFIDDKMGAGDWKEATGKVEVIRYCPQPYGEVGVVVRGVLGSQEYSVDQDAFSDKGVVMRFKPDLYLWRFLRLVT